MIKAISTANPTLETRDKLFSPNIGATATNARMRTNGQNMAMTQGVIWLVVNSIIDKSAYGA